MAKRVKKQHYIPQFLLRNFRIPGEELLWIFDKRTSKKFKSAVRDVASERYYNDAKIGDGYSVSFESRFTMIEDNAAPAFAKLVATEDLGRMTAEEQAAITYFLAAQIIRGKAWRASMTQAYELLCEKLGGKERALLAGVPEMNEDDEKISTLMNLPKTVEEYAPALVTKTWMLQKTSRRQPLWIGDQPIVRQNSTPTDGLTGNTGLASDGIEIYFPITPHLVLALLCPTLTAVIEAGVRYATSALRELEANRLLDAMRNGKPYLLAQGEVTRLNALQVVHADRFIISCHADFAQVEKIIRQRPELSQTPRYVR